MASFDRRSFLGWAGKFSLTAVLGTASTAAWSRNLDLQLQRAGGMTADELAGDEDFWYAVQQAYTVSPSLKIGRAHV